MKDKGAWNKRNKSNEDCLLDEDREGPEPDACEDWTVMMVLEYAGHAPWGNGSCTGTKTTISCLVPW